MKKYERKFARINRQVSGSPALDLNGKLSDERYARMSSRYEEPQRSACSFRACAEANGAKLAYKKRRKAHRTKVVATANRRERVYNRTGKPSVPLGGRGAAAGARAAFALYAEANDMELALTRCEWGDLPVRSKEKPEKRW